jgi:hypothetical protein
MRRLLISAANKFAELITQQRKQKNKTIEMGVKYWERDVYMDIEESGRQY